MSTFPEVKKNFGFGCMRLPMDGEKVDYAEFTKMVDEFMAQGFNYFDTARVYIGGQSETAIRDCVVKRYPRDSFILTDKLSDSLFNSEDEIRPLFEKQLESCGVDYFDFYLLHSQTKSLFEKYKKLHAYEHAFELKKEGKVKHVASRSTTPPMYSTRCLTNTRRLRWFRSSSTTSTSRTPPFRRACATRSAASTTSP